MANQHALRGGVFCVLCLCMAMSAHAQDRFGLWFNPEANTFKFKSDVKATLYSDQDVEDTDTEMQMNEINAGLTVSLFRNEQNEVQFEADFTGFDIDTDARLPLQNTSFPNTLQTISLGTTWRHFCQNGWLVGINGRIGSSSDQLFHSNKELTGGATAFLRVPHKEHNAWLFYLDARNTHVNKGFQFLPLPGVGYQMALNKKSWAVLGAPVMALHYEPFEKLSIDARYMMIRTVSTKLTFKPIQNLGLFGAFDMRSHGFYRHDRKDEEDVLVLRQKKASAGLWWQINEHVRVEGEGGLVFDRFLYEGEKYNQRDKNRLDINDGGFGSFKLTIDF